MCVLNVVEKLLVVKEILCVLLNGCVSVCEGMLRYNKVWEFLYEVCGWWVMMVFMLVMGYLSNFEFVDDRYRRWNGVDSRELFVNVVVVKWVLEDKR